jgi:hypothetical protein
MTINEGSENFNSAQAGVDRPVDGPPVDRVNPATADPMQKYNEERTKRLKTEGISQYIDLALSDKFKHYYDDPWLKDAGTLVPALKDGDHCKYLILGAGFGGLLFAVRLIQKGVDVNDIRIVDSAGGFGGTWYWVGAPLRAHVYPFSLRTYDVQVDSRCACLGQPQSHFLTNTIY